MRKQSNGDVDELFYQVKRIFFCSTEGTLSLKKDLQYQVYGILKSSVVIRAFYNFIWTSSPLIKIWMG
jgi:hypothetical protein